jgi:diaminohydroxyphosphoribosylaminopyrimidine deaminase/5-amino-6-(5-phosphoribosylamino)uracil reductase
VVNDRLMMQRALFHAARAQGATAPNPVVGVVVVDGGGVVVGHGFHEKAGAPHAEVVALGAAGARAAGSTLYVTLEPCCHVGGRRTGPCTSRILEAGVSRVVVATLDPNPRVSGRGVELLRAAGLAVDVGESAAAARRVNAGFLSVHERGRPLVVVKAAASRDAKTAAAPGTRTAISGPEAAQRTQRLRASTDGLAVGIGTILADDPLLTVRDVVRKRPYARVILDRRLRTPPGARVLSTRTVGPVIIVAAPDTSAADPGRVQVLTEQGAVVVAAATLDDMCRSLVGFDVHTLLVEGGARVHRSFWESGLVDRLHLIVAPDTIGSAGVPLFGGYQVAWSRLVGLRSDACGRDTWIEADVHWDR